MLKTPLKALSLVLGLSLCAVHELPQTRGPKDYTRDSWLDNPSEGRLILHPHQALGAEVTWPVGAPEGLRLPHNLPIPGASAKPFRGPKE